MKGTAIRLRYSTYAIVAFIGGVYILKAGSFIFIPLVWAAFFAFALLPLTTWFEERRIPRLVSITLSMVIVAAASFFIIYLFAAQLSSLLEDIPAIRGRLNAFILELNKWVHERFGLEELIGPGLVGAVGERNVGSVVRFTTLTLTSASLIPVFIFLFLYYQDFFREFIIRLMVKNNAAFLDWLKEAIQIVRKYFTGMLLVTIIVSAVASSMFFFMGLKYYLLFGLFTAVCNLIPYVGVILGSIITIIYVLLSTDQLWYPLLTLFLLWFLQVIENNLITPVVVGAKIKLNPLAVIVAIVTGGALWGISGMILFIPILGTIKIFLDKSESLKPYSYLLGDDIPVVESRENLFAYLRKRWTTKKQDSP